MFYSSVSQACGEMNSQAQGQEAGSTVNKICIKKNKTKKNKTTTINICKDAVPLKQSNLNRDEANTVPKIQ